MRRFEFVNKSHRKNESAELPTRSTHRAAAYDFKLPVDINIPPHESVMFWTDVKACMEDDEVLILNVRSSMGKHPIMIANTQGWVDADYYGNSDNDGNIGCRLFNLGSTPYHASKGDRIMQGMFIKRLLTDDDNGGQCERIGGHGSTGK